MGLSSGDAGHIAGFNLLFSSLVPVHVKPLRSAAGADALVGTLRPDACKAAMFAVQAGNYLGNGWFVTKMILLGLALGNAAWHLRIYRIAPAAATASLLVWCAVLVCGRMIAFD